MALETLLRSQAAAIEFLGLQPADLEGEQQGKLYELGDIEIEGIKARAWRAHCGPEEKIGKGGIRITEYPTEREAIRTVQELAVEMAAKLALRGLNTDFKGAKGIISLDANLPYAIRAMAIQKFARRMSENGLAGAGIDVPAGDVGSNGLADVYAQSYREYNSNDHLWQASITGKSAEFGGLPFRTQATGRACYVAQRTMLAQDPRQQDRIDVTFQGFGNVAAWHILAAANDERMVVRAISDVGGTIYTSDPVGLQITEEMVRKIGDNPQFPHSKKIHALAEMLEQPTEIYDSRAVLSLPTDDLVLAAMGNVLTAHNVGSLRVRRAIVEDANGPTHPEAHQYLTNKGIQIVPDIAANGGGVDCSITEYKTNIAMAEGLRAAPPTDSEVQKTLDASTEDLLQKITTVAAHMQEFSQQQYPDLRAAAAALSMARVVIENGRQNLLSPYLVALVQP